MAMIRTKRRGFSWDAEYKEYVAKIRDVLKENGNVEMGNKELFFLCVAVGVKEKVTRPVPARKTDSARLEDLRPEDFALLKSFVVSQKKDADLLLEEDKLYDVIEEYAAGGLAFLASSYDRSPDFRDDLITDFYHFVIQPKRDKKI
jgi:hypothetical protein